MSLNHWLQLALTEGIGPILGTRLVAAAGSAEAACHADGALLRSVEGIAGRAEKIRQAIAAAGTEVEKEISRSESVGARLICLDDPDYPQLLRLIDDPPMVLYVRGTLEARDLNGVGIVGSRRCSHYGREQAERLGALLAGAAITVVSGGARGIDSAAHRGAMMPPAGRTIAVLGCGVDVAYPPENLALFKQIADRGAVISEFPISTPPAKENFPRRNRIISGLSRAVLVVEADIASGALITARLAGTEHGRPVLALPGRVDNPMSAGPHALVRDGATLVTNLEEILEALGPLPDSVTQPPPVIQSELPFEEPKSEAPKPSTVHTFTDRQQAILKVMDNEALAVDRIIQGADLPAEVVMQELTMLTLRGAVKRVDGQTYRRCVN